MDKLTKNVATVENVKPKAEKTVLQVVNDCLVVAPTTLENEAEKPKIKPTLNLEQTLKVIEDLHLKKRHKDSLEGHLTQLDNFEIKQVAEDLNFKNHYTGCKIEITDDNRNSWSLKHPVIISEVVAFIKAKFYEKLAEIEAQIILPN